MNTIIDFYRARKTVFEMLKDRKYKIKDVLIPEDILLEDFKTHYIQKNIDIFVDNKKKQVYVCFICQNKISPAILRAKVEDIKEKYLTKKNKCLIFVMKQPPNNSILKLKLKYEFVQLFWVRTLIINITQHNLVPTHIIISNKEKKQISKKYGDSYITYLPLILKSDPICKYYNMKTNDVCRIIRKTPSSGITEYYRLVS